MSPKYKTGDKVTINGTTRKIASWPENNTGPFVTIQNLPDGGTVTDTLYADQVDIELVETGGDVESTAGDLDDPDTGTGDSLTDAGRIDPDAATGEQQVTNPALNARAANGISADEDVHSIGVDGTPVPTAVNPPADGTATLADDVAADDSKTGEVRFPVAEDGDDIHADDPQPEPTVFQQTEAETGIDGDGDGTPAPTPADVPNKK